MSCEVLSIDNTTYKLLTIGNITKLCSDKIIFDDNGNISLLQWFTFQLDFLFDNLKLDKNDVNTGYKLTRMQMYDILKKMYDCNVSIESNIKNDKESWENYGFINNNIKNSFSNMNIGGNPLFSLEMNSLKSDIVYPKKGKLFGESTVVNKDKKQDVQTQKPQISTKKPQISTKKPQISTKKPALATKRLVSKKVDIPELLVRENDRIINGRQNIKDNQNNLCLKLGKLDWIRNSCYADSILTMIYYRIILGKDSYLSNVLRDFKYTHEMLEYNQALLCPKITVTESVERYNTILGEYRTILEKIRNGDIIHISRLLYYITQCPIGGIENFNDGLFHDSSEFLNTFLRYFMMDIENANIEKQYFFSVENNNIDSILALRNINLDYNIPKTDALGNSFATYVEGPIQKNGLVQNYVIKNEILGSLYKRIEAQDKSIESSLSGKKNEYMYDFHLNKTILKKDAVKYNIQKMTISEEIQNMLVSKSIDYFSDDTYHIINPEYTYKETGEGYFFFRIEDQNDVTKWLPYNKLDKGIAIKLKTKITESILDNNTDDIFINLERLLNKVYNSVIVNKILNVKIIPNEIIDINGTEYILQGINIHKDNHYVSFIRCNDIYYLYDDNYNPEIRTDYLSEVGPYSELVKFGIGKTKNVVLTNSRILHYVKK